MKPAVVAVAVAALFAFPAGAAPQDPAWTLIRPNVTWANQWKVEPRSRALHSALDEAIYIDQRPSLVSDCAAAARPGRRIVVGFSDIAQGTERFAGGQLWLYIGIKKRTRVDIAARTRRNGSVVTLSAAKRLTPPITVAPEEPPVGPNGFRAWLPVSLPALTRDEANHLSAAVRISPSSPKRSFSRVYAVFAELYPDGS